MNSTPIDRIAVRLAEAEAMAERFDSDRDMVAPDTAAEIRAKFPGIPEDYLAYLQKIGAGSFLSCSYAIYSSPIRPEDVFGSRDPSWPDNLLVFGDNFCGDLGVFEPSSGWAVGELWHDDRTIMRSEKSFSEFIETLIIALTADSAQ